MTNCGGTPGHPMTTCGDAHPVGGFEETCWCTGCADCAVSSGDPHAALSVQIAYDRLIRKYGPAERDVQHLIRAVRAESAVALQDACESAEQKRQVIESWEGLYRIASDRAAEAEAARDSWMARSIVNSDGWDTAASNLRDAENDLDTATRELSALSSDKQTLMTAVTHWRERAEQLGGIRTGSVTESAARWKSRAQAAEAEAATLQAQIFQALDNAGENGYDFRGCEPESVIVDMQTFDAVCESVDADLLRPHVAAWLASHPCPVCNRVKHEPAPPPVAPLTCETCGHHHRWVERQLGGYWWCDECYWDNDDSEHLPDPTPVAPPSMCMAILSGLCGGPLPCPAHGTSPATPVPDREGR